MSEEVKEWRLQKAETEECQTILNYLYLVIKYALFSVGIGMPDEIIAEKHLLEVTTCLNTPKITPL